MYCEGEHHRIPIQVKHQLATNEILKDDLLNTNSFASQRLGWASTSMTVNDRFPGCHGKGQSTCQTAHPSMNSCLWPSFSPSTLPRCILHPSMCLSPLVFSSPSKLPLSLHSVSFTVLCLFHPHTSSLLHPFLHPPLCFLSPLVSLLLTLP